MISARSANRGYRVLARSFRTRWAPSPPRPATPGDRIVYAVGDIHGQLDLLNLLICHICADALLARPERRPVIVFLGDYVDRGLGSRAVIERILSLQRGKAFEIRALKGNHEEQMLAFLADPLEGEVWLNFGGAETLAAYGVERPRRRAQPKAWEQARISLLAALPAEHLDFLNNLEVKLVCEDYLFVHAGVRPGVSLDAQSDHDLLWIRNEFLSSKETFEKVVVHGHTPAKEPYLGVNRIGVDTGAYASGILSAVKLSGDQRSILQAIAPLN